jgi:putative transcriptional regulator
MTPDTAAPTIRPAIENDISPREIADLRRHLGLSQEQFAEHLGAAVDTLKSWETGRRRPSGAARKALRDLAVAASEKVS